MSNDDALYLLNDAAALLGVAPLTIRKYEKDGLFTARRDLHGARVYSDADIEKLRRLIKQRQERHGLTGVRRRHIFVTSTVTGK